MLNKDNLKAIKDYVAWIVCSVFPGLFILELIYHKGLSGGGIKSIYDFILLCIWGFIISTPYREMNEWSVNLDSLKLKKIEERELLESQLLIFPLISLPIFTYLIFQLISSLHIIKKTGFIGIPSVHIIFGISFIITIGFSFIVGKIYNKLLKIMI